jgi:hypothetical protein
MFKDRKKSYNAILDKVRNLLTETIDEHIGDFEDDIPYAQRASLLHRILFNEIAEINMVHDSLLSSASVEDSAGRLHALIDDMSVPHAKAFVEHQQNGPLGKLVTLMTEVDAESEKTEAEIKRRLELVETDPSETRH